MNASSGFDPVIHPPGRLAIMGLLVACEEAQFSFVRESTGLSDSVLSRHLGVLEAAGYLTIRKGTLGARRCTWLSATERGRRAVHDHVEALQAILDQARSALAATPPRKRSSP